MDRRKIIIIGGVVLIVIIIILGIVAFLKGYSLDSVINKKNESEPVTPVASSSLPISNDPVRINYENATLTEEDLLAKNAPRDLKDDLSQLSASFAERFGSWSNQSNYSNISDLKMFMTTRMQAWANTYIAEQISKNNNASQYYGISTWAASEEVKDLNESDGTATIIVKTFRQETANSDKPAYEQNVQIKLVRENDVWKGDSAYWQ
jgi:hypothetical protein